MSTPHGSPKGPTHKQSQAELASRWRLVLGKEAEEHGMGLCGAGEDVEGLLGYVFGMGASDSTDERRASLNPGHAMTLPDWINQVDELFPGQTREVLEAELVQRRGIGDLLESPDLLERIEPNMELAKTLLTHSDLMTEETRALARKIIDRVVQELKEKLKPKVEPAITGAIRRDRHSPRKVVRNFDVDTTIRRNLQHYDAENERLLVDRLYFYASERNKRPWHIILAVDQSGSMLDSAIFSGVMASIFYELPGVRTSLFLFDTSVVDLTDMVGQPVDVLMSIQLGGGTDIASALKYAAQLVREPARTIVVAITDFYEGGSEAALIRQVKEMSLSGVRMVGLGALGYDAQPEYNRSTAKKCRKVGMSVLSCTPESLAASMARIIRG